MKTIWKFTSKQGDHDDDERHIEMPQGANVLHAVAKAEWGRLVLTVWAVVDPDANNEDRVFLLRGTGHPLGLVGPHVATCLDGPFVWHVFEAPYFHAGQATGAAR